MRKGKWEPGNLQFNRSGIEREHEINKQMIATSIINHMILCLTIGCQVQKMSVQSHKLTTTVLLQYWKRTRSIATIHCCFLSIAILTSRSWITDASNATVTLEASASVLRMLCVTLVSIQS